MNEPTNERRLDVSLLEQPLPADDDDFLLGFRSPVPLCADESMHTSDSLGLGADGDEACARLLEKYQVGEDRQQSSSSAYTTSTTSTTIIVVIGRPRP